jgi:hypothetical protein
MNDGDWTGAWLDNRVILIHVEIMNQWVIVARALINIIMVSTLYARAWLRIVVVLNNKVAHMCKPCRKSRAQEKCRKRPRRTTTKNAILYLIGCETCMQYSVAGLKLFWRDRDAGIRIVSVTSTWPFPALQFSCEIYTFGLFYSLRNKSLWFLCRKLKMTELWVYILIFMKGLSWVSISIALFTLAYNYTNKQVKTSFLILLIILWYEHWTLIFP